MARMGQTIDRPEEGDLGRRVRALREGRGLSLRALSRASGIAPAALSQIENNRSSPSVSTLKRVLQALGTTLGEFFASQEAAGDDPGYVIRAGRLVNVASGAGLRYLAPPGAGRGKLIQIMHEVYERGADTGPRLYVHEGEEAGFCVAGSIEVTIGRRREILRPGDAYQFPSSLPHRWRNVGAGKAQLISACTPPSF
jgi:transcriptional regulator with XRE-family HTH domain